MKGQLSAEMLVVLVVLLGVAVLLASTMMKSAGTASREVEDRTAKAMNTSASGEGISCTSQSDCPSGQWCDLYKGRCV